MGLVKDIILDTDKDVEFFDGDFIVSPSDEQHIVLIMDSLPGAWKQYPLMGAGIAYDLNSPLGVDGIKKKIKLYIAMDGYSIISLAVSPPKDIKINAKRIIQPN